MPGFDLPQYPFSGRVLQGGMQTLASIIGALVLAGIAGMAVWRWSDHRADQAEWDRLAALQPTNPARFEPAMVAGLPGPAQRYFRFTIRPGTPLFTVARIDMAGRFGMGTRDTPKYMDMTARQILAPPTGFVWKMRATRGLMHLSGSDSGSWTRFWLMGLVPVARIGGNPDHARSAFGRFVAEAVFWAPAALLPGPGIDWEYLDDSSARVIIRRDGITQPVDIAIDEEGRPGTVSFPRWSDANSEKTYRIQPFGGFLSDFRHFGGFTLPTHVEAGNHFGTDDYFPFFIIDVSAITFPGSRANDL
jgi:hypothetical protein